MHLCLQFCNCVQISCCLLFNLFLVFGSTAAWFYIHFYLQLSESFTSSRLVSDCKQSYQVLAAVVLLPRAPGAILHQKAFLKTAITFLFERGVLCA